MIGVLTFVLANVCVAQKSELPAKMPKEATFSFSESAGMVPAYKRINIENGVLEFEELTRTDKTPRKWTAKVSGADLKKLYKVFVENKFDTIKNDESQIRVYDAGSERISISAGYNKSFGITADRNSPLSGKNLERYQSVRRALMDLVAKYQNRKSNG